MNHMVEVAARRLAQANLTTNETEVFLGEPEKDEAPVCDMEIDTQEECQLKEAQHALIQQKEQEQLQQDMLLLCLLFTLIVAIFAGFIWSCCLLKSKCAKRHPKPVKKRIGTEMSGTTYQMSNSNREENMGGEESGLSTAHSSNNDDDGYNTRRQMLP